MHAILALIAVLAAILFFVIRARRAVGDVRDLHRETKPLQHKARDAIASMVGTPLGRVRDPGLAGAVLMVQIVRSEGAMTAEEKNAILDRLADPIGAAEPQEMFERAWGLSAQGGFFSQASDQLTPLLRDRLNLEEKNDLVEMLRGVASAHGEPSELQRGSIARFSRRLFA